MHATYTSPRIYPSPVSLENPYKINGNFPYNQTVHATYTSPCIPPLSLWKILRNFPHNQTVHATYVYLSTYPSPVSLENPYKWKFSLQHSARNKPLHVSLPYRALIFLMYYMGIDTICNVGGGVQPPKPPPPPPPPGVYTNVQLLVIFLEIVYG